jgi:hypothetical protein
MQYLGVVVPVLVFGTGFVLGWLRRHQETPLRREVKAQRVILRTNVTAKLVSVIAGNLVFRGLTKLTIRPNAFDVSAAFPLARAVFNQEYYFRARETTIEMSPGMRKDWILFTGRRQNGRGVQLLVSTTNYPIREIWDALVGAGAVPIGPPPQAPFKDLPQPPPYESQASHD